QALGESTPLQDGTLLPVQARLDFTTGGLIGTTANSWVFSPGGSFTIIGTVTGVVNASSTLFSGQFTDTPTLIDLGSGNFKVLGGAVLGSINATLAQYFGLPTQPLYQGGISLLFHGPGHVPGAFVNHQLNSGDLAFNSVPEPASW